MNCKRLALVLLALMLLPSLAMAQAGTRATFNVSKNWVGGTNPFDVQMTLSCNTGLPLEQTHGVDVEFVVVDFDDGELDCEMTEEPVEGYEVSNYRATTNGAGEVNSPDSCLYEDVADGDDHGCIVTNTPAPVEVLISKEWIVEGDNNGVSQNFDIDLYCTSEIVEGHDDGPYWHFSGSGTGDTDFTLHVIPDFGGTNCDLDEESYDSAIEVSNGCEEFELDIGDEGYSCTITNTVFFEGIPTLSQTGLAILALLMLGVGFVGFRRFA